MQTTAADNNAYIEFRHNVSYILNEALRCYDELTIANCPDQAVCIRLAADLACRIAQEGTGSHDNHIAMAGACLMLYAQHAPTNERVQGLARDLVNDALVDTASPAPEVTPPEAEVTPEEPSLMKQGIGIG